MIRFEKKFSIGEVGEYFGFDFEVDYKGNGVYKIRNSGFGIEEVVKVSNNSECMEEGISEDLIIDEEFYSKEWVDGIYNVNVNEEEGYSYIWVSN